MSGAAAFDGVVLAGGRSSRMGTDKAGLRWGGQSLLEHMAALLQQSGAVRVLTSGPHAGAHGLPDQQPGLGPLGGLLTLAQTQADGIYLLVPVDMPLLRVTLLRRLAAAVCEAPEVACAIVAGYPLPLCLRLDDVARRAINALAAKPPRERSLRALHAMLAGATLTLGEGDAACLVNCNTPEQWQEVAR